MARQLRYWIPAICVALLISVFSTHYFDCEQTTRILLPILHWLFPSASHHMLREMHVAIRKAAHITEFAAFSITVFHGVRGERYGWKLDCAIIALVTAVSYAGLDEWHQSFLPVREARFRDVLNRRDGCITCPNPCMGLRKTASEFCRFAFAARHNRLASEVHVTRLRDSRRGFVGVGALVTAAIHRRSHVVVRGPVLNRGVRITYAANEPPVDLRVAAPTCRAPVDVIAGNR